MVNLFYSILAYFCLLFYSTLSRSYLYVLSYIDLCVFYILSFMSDVSIWITLFFKGNIQINSPFPKGGQETWPELKTWPKFWASHFIKLLLHWILIIKIMNAMPDFTALVQKLRYFKWLLWSYLWIHGYSKSQIQFRKHSANYVLLLLKVLCIAHVNKAWGVYINKQKKPEEKKNYQ